MQLSKKKQNTFRIFFLVKALLIFSVSAIFVLLILLLAVWLWYSRSVKSISLRDLRVENCDQLPDLLEVDNTFTRNKQKLSVLLNELSQCENNVFVCKRYGECQTEDYAKRRISSGNTSLEWKKVNECNKQNKAAVLISQTSACEIQKLNDFFKSNSDFDFLPIKNYNY